ncbi:nuclear speckle splicing regulatory protein 1 [Helicoverpa armigera]|uniref:nuclear speckle splicing regulatory protein 1 n=1 Tax=Helicoverpa armigera TaxID=29058 RepID=UPI003082C0A4
MSNKKYGLILSDKGKPKPTFQASRNVFGNDSDSEEDSKRKPTLLRPSDITTRQAKITQEKALTEDPTVYQYDEIYDEMVTKKDKEKVKTKEEKKPQYIENLMKAANKRKIENERRIERQVQKEREKEGDEFQDKEVFVTSAYKKKLEEMRLEEEKEKREEYLENIGDVTKQNDLGGFYRHLYEQKLGKNVNKEENGESNKGVEDGKSDLSKSNASNSTDTQKKRNYRKRKSSDRTRLSEGEIEDSDEEINRVNLDDIRLAKKYKQDNIDADSDFSIDESSDEDKDKNNDETEKPLNTKNKDTDAGNPLEKDSISKNNKTKSKENKVDDNKPKEKIDIWKKRTIGPVYEEALKRYYERKAARGC